MLRVQARGPDVIYIACSAIPVDHLVLSVIFLGDQSTFPFDKINYSDCVTCVSGKLNSAF